MTFFHYIVQLIVQLLSLLIFVDVIVSFFLSPYNKFRMVLDTIVNPMLKPIQRVLPPVGNFDFSPIVLLVAIQLIGNLLIRFL